MRDTSCRAQTAHSSAANTATGSQRRTRCHRVARSWCTSVSEARSIVITEEDEEDDDDDHEDDEVVALLPATGTQRRSHSPATSAGSTSNGSARRCCPWLFRVLPRALILLPVFLPAEKKILPFFPLLPKLSLRSRGVMSDWPLRLPLPGLVSVAAPKVLRRRLLLLEVNEEDGAEGRDLALP